MTNTIKFKRSTVAGKVPTTADLTEGEPCYNVADGYIYMEKTINGVSTVVRFSPDNQNTGYGTNFFAFNNQHGDDDHRTVVFVPPCPINLIQLYSTTVYSKSREVTISLYKNFSILLGEVTIGAGDSISPRLTFLNPPSIGITDILTVDYSGNEHEKAITTFITW